MLALRERDAATEVSQTSPLFRRNLWSSAATLEGGEGCGMEAALVRGSVD